MEVVSHLFFYAHSLKKYRRVGVYSSTYSAVRYSINTTNIRIK